MWGSAPVLIRESGKVGEVREGGPRGEPDLFFCCCCI